MEVPIPRPSRWARLTRRATSRLGAFGVTGALAVGLLAPLLGPCDPPPPPPPSPTTTTTTTQLPPAPPPASNAQQQVVNITNQRRAERGLPALTVDSRLVSAAQNHSAYQASINTMTHTGSGGTNGGQRITAAGYRWSAWGENVAWGYPDATAVMNAWMNSTGHRNNILSTNFTQIGVGLAYSTGGTPYWTMVLARPG